MQHVVAHAIPCVMIGTTNRASHAVDEWVSIDEIATFARTITRIIIRNAGSDA